jgi:putative spermidine/putrescine transport system permease protein
VVASDGPELGLRFGTALHLASYVTDGSSITVQLVSTTSRWPLASRSRGSRCRRAVTHDHQFWTSFRVSFILSLETIAISLILFVPTIYWVHLKLPRLRSLMGFLALVPFVVPPIVLVVGLLNLYKGSPSWFYDKPYGFLVAAYVILAFPYMYFSLDAGFRSIDVHTLTEASQSLGASWRTTLLKVILPNIRAAALAGSFLTLAIVMGEFTIASLAAFNTFPTYIAFINESKAYEAAALSLLSFLITWAAMLSLLFVGRGRPRPAVAAVR